MRIGWLEIVLIVILVMVLFGSNKIPGMMKNLAEGLRIFKKEVKSPTPKKQEKKPVKKSVQKKKK